MAGIYIHIPFCKKRCFYCDFYSTTNNKHNAFLCALQEEIKERKKELNGEPVSTVYLGGGTPSQLSAEEIQLIFETLREEKLIVDNHIEEITIEANPDDLTQEYIQKLTALTPINRISIGVQTFNNNILRLINRRHTAQQVFQAITYCRASGLTNYSIDLIYGLPNQTLEIWKEDLRQALLLAPAHISAYHLTYEKGTELEKMRQRGEVAMPSEEMSVAYFDILRSTLLGAGYIEYEISNFCLPHQHARHNSNYWLDIPYLGLGPSAHSYDGKKRQWNSPSLAAYCNTHTRRGSVEVEEIDPQTKYNDLVVTRLRTIWGIKISDIRAKIDSKYADFIWNEVQTYIQSGHIVYNETDDTVTLSPEGLFISDRIMTDLLYVKD